MQNAGKLLRNLITFGRAYGGEKGTGKVSITGLILFLLVHELTEVYQTQAAAALSMHGFKIGPPRCGDYFNEMVHTGLLQMRPGDQVRKYYSLTPQGKKLAEELLA